MNERIQQELALIDTDHPGYLRRFQQHMYAGQIDGGAYYITRGCGCFYGWLYYDIYEDSEDSATSPEIIANDYSSHFSELSILTLTPIEAWIQAVEPGDTPATSYYLQNLDEEIELYFASKASHHQGSDDKEVTHYHA